MSDAIVDRNGNVIGGGAHAAAPTREQHAMQQRWQVLTNLAQRVVDAERKGFAESSGFSQLTFSLQVRFKLTNPLPGARVPICPGLTGRLVMYSPGGKSLVEILVRDVRAMFEQERASGEPTPEIGLDPAVVWERALLHAERVQRERDQSATTILRDFPAEQFEPYGIRVEQGALAEWYARVERFLGKVDFVTGVDIVTGNDFAPPQEEQKS